MKKNENEIVFIKFKSTKFIIYQTYSRTEICSIYSAIELVIFELLENESHTAYQIKEKIKLNCQIRNLIDFLDVLHSKGHIERIGILEDARYKTSHNLFLKSNPINMIAIIYWVYKVFRTLMRLPEALRTGNIQGENSFIEFIKMMI